MNLLTGAWAALSIITAVELVAIGTVRSPLTDVASAPKQGDEGAPEAWLDVAAEFAEGLDGIAVGDRCSCSLDEG